MATRRKVPFKQRKLTISEIEDVRISFFIRGESKVDIAKKFNITLGRVSHILKGESK